MYEQHELGKLGEAFALHFLKEQGFAILEQNWRFKKDEVDLIAQHADYLVVVEVKTRSSAYFGEPFLAVTKKKQQFLIRAANAYIEQHHVDLECRFDIVSIVISADKKPEIEHIKDAFYPL